MKILSLAFLLLALSLPALAEISSEVSAGVPVEGSATTTSVESSPAPDVTCMAIGCPQIEKKNDPALDAGKTAREEYKADRDAIRAKFAEARAKRKEAMQAARLLSGEEREAAMAAARAEFREAIAAMRAERKAAREKFKAARNGSESDALIAANNANKTLEGNAKKNEEVNQQILVASEEAPVKELPPSSASVETREPAAMEEHKYRRKFGSTVSAQ